MPISDAPATSRDAGQACRGGDGSASAETSTATSSEPPVMPQVVDDAGSAG